MNNDQQIEAAAKAVWAHVKVGNDPAWEDVVAGDGWEDDVSQVREMARAGLAAAHPTITTATELDDWGPGTRIIAGDYFLLRSADDTDDSNWIDLGTGCRVNNGDMARILPATVLYWGQA